MGDRNLPGDFSKVYAWPSMGSFANAANNFWNNNGWEFDEEFQSKLLSVVQVTFIVSRHLHKPLKEIQSISHNFGSQCERKVEQNRLDLMCSIPFWKNKRLINTCAIESFHRIFLPPS